MDSNINNQGNVTEIRKQTVKATVEVLGEALITPSGNAWGLRNVGGIGLDTTRTFASREAALSYLADFVSERTASKAA